ncbi:HIT family protein [Candidatus Bathyarchaeota archaeon]|nr:HIT family protein [Candidatus Bathyarchaeota archaeon]
MSERCLFCAIAAGRVPAHVVYEDDRVVAFLDIHPSAPGHTLIIPRAHVTRIEDLSPEDASALFTALHRLTKPIREAVEAEAATVGINDGPGSGQEVPHVHIHVIPRRRGDGGTLIQLVARTGTRGTSLADVADKIRKKIAQPTNN